jgi:putative ABC transport system permease protein
MALGARPGGILNLVLAYSLRLVLFGVIAGLTAALLLTRLMKSLLYEVEANDPLILG